MQDDKAIAYVSRQLKRYDRIT